MDAIYGRTSGKSIASSSYDHYVNSIHSECTVLIALRDHITPPDKFPHSIYDNLDLNLLEWGRWSHKPFAHPPSLPILLGPTWNCYSRIPPWSIVRLGLILTVSEKREILFAEEIFMVPSTLLSTGFPCARTHATIVPSRRYPLVEVESTVMPNRDRSA